MPTVAMAFPIPADKVDTWLLDRGESLGRAARSSRRCGAAR